MKVWQPGGHLSEERGGEVRDWSWRRTRRRIGVLARLTLPYKGRTALALATLLAYTLVALAPPYLAKLAIDEGIEGEDLSRLTWIVALFLGSAVVALAALGREHLPHRLDGRARARRPPQQALRPARAALARLLRAQPRRRDHQPDHERRRGARPARHGRSHEPRPEHAPAPRHCGRSLLPRRQARARNADGAAADGDRDRLVPEPLQPRLPQCPRAARPRHRHARRGHRRDARRPVVHAGAGAAEGLPRRERPLPRRQLRDDGAERDLLPGRRLSFVRRNRDRLRLRRLARLPRRDEHGHSVRLRALPVELLRPDPAALAALQHVPLRDRGAGQDPRRARREAAGRRRRRRDRAAADRRTRSVRRRPLRLRAGVPRGAARARPRRPCRHDRGARRTHRRRQVDDREADRTLLRPDRGHALDRRPRPARRDAALAQTPARDRPAGRVPVRRHGRARTSRSAVPTPVPRRSRPPPRPSVRSASSWSSRTATRRSSASAAHASRSASASSSPSLVPSSPTRGS